MMEQYKKIVCDVESVDQQFQGEQEVHLVVESSCKKLSIAVEAGSLIKIVLEYAGDAHELDIQTVLGEKSQLCMIPLFLTDQSIEQSFSFVLKGNQSSVTVQGLAVLSNHDRIKIRTSQQHQGVGTSSQVEIFSVIDGQAEFDYEGIIHIEEAASKTVANQQNKNIVLSKKASVRSVPTIEVLNKNVQCFHGSAIGSFDREQQWYLQSRGLEKAAVQKILLDAFCEPVLKQIAWRKVIEKQIQKKLL